MTLIFVASLNENMKLANTIKDKLNKQNIDSKIINLVNLELPMYDSLKEQNDGIPLTRLGSIVMPREIIATYEKPINEDSLGRILDQFGSFIKE